MGNPRENPPLPLGVTMTRKHFREFAEEIKQVKDIKVRRETATIVAKVCRYYNILFDTKKFYKACDVPEIS